MNLYTSDLHFGHEKVIELDERPFADVEEMEKVMIENWNRKVRDTDTVYILGDVCLKGSKDPAWYLDQLAGHKCLIIGNHDSELLKNAKAMRYFDRVGNIVFVKDQLPKQGQVSICLCHYPMASWRKKMYGAWHIYGHIHNKNFDGAHDIMRRVEHALNAGCMINGYEPVTFEELIENNRRFWEQYDEAVADKH